MSNTNFQTFHQMGQAINEVVRQATGRDAVQNIDMDHVTVAQNQYYEEVTVSGSKVSFTDRVGNTPLEKCVVQIEPVQDLHGYSRPWAGGAGKNLLKPVKNAGQSTTFSGMTVEFNADGSVSVFGTKDAQDGFRRIAFGTARLGAGSYIVTGQNLADALDKLTLQVMNGTTQLTNMSYSSAQSFSFTLTGEADIDVNIGFRDGCSLTTPVTMYPMVRLASVTDDTFEPYSNICPITGWTGANIHVSPTTEAQDGTTYSITFPAEAGTVYGGTLTINKDGTGTLLVDRAKVTLTGNEALRYSSITKSFFTNEDTVPGMLCKDYTLAFDGLCDRFVPYNGTTPWLDLTTACIGYLDQNNPRLRFSIPGETAVTDAVRAILAGTEVVYRLAAPLTYTLTNEQIETLLGANNIWADTGDIEVTYKVLKELY